MRKKILSVIAVLALCLTLLPTTALADGGAMRTHSGNLDLSDTATAPGDLSADGYHWDAAARILTLDRIEVTGTLTLPDNDPVEVRTLGESSISTIDFRTEGQSYQSYAADVTFSGPAALTVQNSLDSYQPSHLTVAEGAELIALRGISVGASGGVDSSLTVNGKLTATGVQGFYAIYIGKVTVGSTGVLTVSGTRGIRANGVFNGSSDFLEKLRGTFRILDGGTFIADCTDCNVMVFASYSEVDAAHAPSLIDLPSGYLPEGYALRLIRGLNGVNFQYAVAVAREQEPLELLSEQLSGGGGPLRLESPGAGGNNDDGPDVYVITVEDAANGSVTASHRIVQQDTPVTLTAVPGEGCRLSSLTAVDQEGNALPLSELGGGTYRFSMPASPVTVRAAFTSSAHSCPSLAFKDLDSGKWYHEAVDFVLINDLMQGCGDGTFGPNDTLSRGQLCQILYNKEGRPAVSGSSPFADVPDSSWCADAVKWAVSKAIVTGYDDGSFRPNAPITREQLAAMLWRYAGSPASSYSLSRFTDAGQISGYARTALAWASESGILDGKDGLLDPKGNATRAEAAQMLMRFSRKGTQ